MPKLGVDKMRQRQLVKATLDAIPNHGVSVARASQISVRTAFVNDMVSAHFADTDEPFEQKLAKFPIRRVSVSADGAVNSKRFTEKSGAAWAQVCHRPKLTRTGIHYAIYASSALPCVEGTRSK